MNCKPGDLAIIVRSAAGNEGKIVRCIRLIAITEHVVFKTIGPAWEVDKMLPSVIKGQDNRFQDCNLRPIRPDETPEESTEAMKRLHDTRKEVKA